MVKSISGEQSLKVGDKSYALRLSFSAMAEIESHFDKSLIALLDGGQPKLSVIGFIFSQMAGIDTDEAWDVIEEVGFADASEKIVDVISSTLNPKKKRQAAGKSQTV